MVALSLQTLLLMGVAYFLGAVIACTVRRALYSRSSAAATGERRVDPLPEAAQATANRFGTAAAGAPVQKASASAAPVAAPAGEAQDLKRIRLIDPALEAGLNKLGVARYEQIAAWMRGDVERVEQALGLKGRINQENWIEQAQVLAKGGETHYSSRRARGETAKADPTPDEGERRPIAPAAAAAPPRGQTIVSPRPATGGASAVAADIIRAAPIPPIAPPMAPPAPDKPADVASRAAFAVENKAPAPAPTAGTQPSLAPAQAAAPMRPVMPTARDNLQRISGIDAQTEQRLATLNVTRYSQIAQWSPADVDRIGAQVGAAGRIQRENWIEQAQILSRGGDTAFSREYDRREAEAAGQLRPAKLSDAIRTHSAVKTSEDNRGAAAAAPPRTDISTLRSVRSEVYQSPEPGPEAARRVVAQNKVVRSAALEDLKRIRGIGVLIEKKLNSMGVVSYEQIANWSATDIDRVSQTLDFKGRIERENWIEQARILASGGATDFSRRMDRGEIETSRLKT